MFYLMKERRSKKTRLWLLPAPPVWLLITGMGRAPGPDIPVPDRNFTARVEDDQGISTKISQISWNGETYFSGLRGKGAVTIPFEKVKRITSTGSYTAGMKDFQVTLVDGEVVAVSLDEDSRITGRASFGTFSIKARNIKEIVFKSP